MKAFEEPCFSGNMSYLMFFHTCIIRMITLTNYFSPVTWLFSPLLWVPLEWAHPSSELGGESPWLSWQCLEIFLCDLQHDLHARLEYLTIREREKERNTQTAVVTDEKADSLNIPSPIHHYLSDKMTFHYPLYIPYHIKASGHDFTRELGYFFPLILIFLFSRLSFCELTKQASKQTNTKQKLSSI